MGRTARDYYDQYVSIQFRCNPETPSMILRACVATGVPTQTRYVQQAVAAALARDLDLDVDDLLAALPPTRQGNGTHLFDPIRRRTNPWRTGGFNTNETAK